MCSKENETLEETSQESIVDIKKVNAMVQWFVKSKR